MRAQIEAFPPLQPSPQSPRNSPIAGVLLTNADLDHALGLFSLREGMPLNIFAPSAVRDVLTRELGLTNVLDTFCGAIWHEPPTTEPAPLAANLSYRAIPLPGNPPPFTKNASRDGIHSVAYEFTDTHTGGRLVVAPDVAALNPELLAALNHADAVLFDGTFWSPEELPRVKSAARTAGEMGHLTIKDDSLNLLTKLPARRKIYLHINNTNPVLLPDSPERIAVEAAGLTVGHDEIEFQL